VRSRHPLHHRRHKPYLVDNRLLSERFRDAFLAGLAQLYRNGELKLDGSWSFLKERAAFAAWLKTFSGCAWVVFIEPPPTENADPEHVLKYLARYLTGGPISDHRLISHQDDRVSFWARGHNKQSGNQREPYTLPGVEFTRRWAMHILPKGFVKSRCFGGFSCRHRKAYLRRCCELLECEPPEREDAEEREPGRACPKCQTPMECISEVERPGWKRIFHGPDRPWWYDPFGHAVAWGCLDWYRTPPDG
jgi:hypothetical protein